MRSTLYEISSEISALLSTIDALDGEITDDLTIDLMNLEDALEDKVHSCCCAIREKEARAAGMSLEIDRLTAQRDAEKRVVEWLKGYVKAELERIGQKKIETPLFRVTVCKNGQASVRLDEGVPIPDDFKKEKTIIELDREKVLAAHKTGEPLPSGVQVLHGTHLRIT